MYVSKGVSIQKKKCDWIVFNRIVHQLIILLIIHTVTSIDFRLLHKMLTNRLQFESWLKSRSIYFCLDDVVHSSCEWCIVISYNCITNYNKTSLFLRGGTNSCMFKSAADRCCHIIQRFLAGQPRMAKSHVHLITSLRHTLFLFDFTALFCQITDNVRPNSINKTNTKTKARSLLS